MTEIQHIQDFLPCATPDKWLENALGNQTLMLVDHANCEKKAASTALNLIYKYTDDFDRVCSHLYKSKITCTHTGEFKVICISPKSPISKYS